jgi:ferric-chelate reductase [NAD(P)H]
MDPRAMWSLSYGIFIVSSCFEGKANGQIANTVFQISAEPARVAVAINKENYTHQFIEKSRMFSVTVLDDETPMKLIGVFGFRTGKDVDKFEGVETMEGDFGCPVVTEHAVSVFEAKVFDSVDVGTHTLFVADVVNGKMLTDKPPLTYAQYHANKGKAPEKAPTYRGAAGEKAPTYTGVEPPNAPTYRGPETGK